MKVLKKIHQEYNKNFKKLLKTVGTPEHKTYVDIERILNFKEINHKKRLGIFIDNICPINSNKSCLNCTGYYKKNLLYKGVKSRQKRYIQCSKEDNNAQMCVLSEENIRKVINDKTQELKGGK